MSIVHMYRDVHMKVYMHMHRDSSRNAHEIHAHSRRDYVYNMHEMYEICSVSRRDL